MFTAIRYVLHENLTNMYRIFSIARYQLLADIRDSRFGIAWNFLSPAIQVFTYWLVFGVAWNRKPIEFRGVTVDYLSWLVVGYSAWWFVQPCLTNGCRAIFDKIGVISKMKFPVSILPATVVMQELFNHGFMLIIALGTLLISGWYPNWYWLQIFYYIVCAIAFSEAMALILSVLTMLWRDTRKLVVSLTRMLMYFTPIIWDCQFGPHVPFYRVLNRVMKLNPLYYIVTGYRESIFYNVGFWDHYKMTIYFWVVIFILFAIGCMLMYRFKKKFIDLI